MQIWVMYEGVVSKGRCGVWRSVMMSCRRPKLAAVCFAMLCEAGAGAGEPEARASQSLLSSRKLPPNDAVLGRREVGA